MMTNIFPGDILFKLRSTNGLPLDISLNRIIVKEKMTISWIDFIEEARKNKWWDFKIYDVISYGLYDALVDKDIIRNILIRIQYYMVKFPL